MSAPDRPTGALCEEILAEARRRAEAILGRAREQAATLLGRAQAEAEAARRERLGLARAEATRRRELLLGTVPLETARLRSARIEALLASVQEEVGRRLLGRKGFDYRETLIRLAAEAVRQMTSEVLVVSLAPEDHARFGTGLAEEIARRVGRSPLRLTLAGDPAVTGGGLVVADAEGRQLWDNRLAARLTRLWPELRRQLAVQAGLVAGGRP